MALLLFRFVYGLGAATNLNNGYPWGLWVVLDIHITAAIGCGGYVLAVVIYVMNKGEFHTLIRPAILASTFAYTLANFAALVDLGRWWNFYQIALPWNINLNSVMFEVAICMALYTLVLWIELVPPALEHFGKQKYLDAFYKSLWVIIPLGIVLPTMHQSGLGGLIIAAGNKVSPLWQTPWIGFLFLTTRDHHRLRHRGIRGRADRHGSGPATRTAPVPAAGQCAALDAGVLPGRPLRRSAVPRRARRRADRDARSQHHVPGRESRCT